MGNLLTEVAARLNFKTDKASADALGFIANQVVTEGYIQANSQGTDYNFCLREIDMSTTETLSGFSIPELISITDSSGCDLAMMPLVKFNNSKEKSALSVVTRLQSFALPIDITVWFDENDFKNSISDAADRELLVSELASAGYSVGYYGGGGCECSPNSVIKNGSTVLNAVSCGTSSVPSHTFPTITIGDNSSACQIRWVSAQ
ncbi:hypothetical protein L2755_19705 [Shewanella abyssi]|uniref:hypothetical protein n=1 Tax=Shewanella abyssi TaxID=311789 RepID=UPI00200CFCEE|nr:hypothetical protein [Shewanella abyssi]MCL1051832.1 hypothetical protein [Shewanella abyssi]